MRMPRPGFLMALCLAVGLGAGAAFDRWASMTFVPSDAVSDFRLMSESWNTIQRYYVDRAAVKPRTLTYGAISGMVDALGDTGHSAFLSPGMVKQLSVAESGRLKGIGVQVDLKQGHVVIVAPIDNSPAQRAGLRSGEIILSVNGRDIAGLPLSRVVGRISGPVGTSVTLAILDPQTHHVRNVTLVRAMIQLHNVTWQRLPGTKIADVRIAAFNTGVDRDLRQALREIQQQQLRGLILDLRNNPGGVLEEAVAVASQFLTRGNVLLIRDANGKTTPMPVRAGGLAPEPPLAVLINGGTASAAEIVAGALRDAHRAELIGATTFGTGTVLKEFPLADASALMLAVQEWLTPDGHSFWHKGITPQISVALPPDATPLVPSAERDMTADELQSSKDKQLRRALEWVATQIGNGNAGSDQTVKPPAQAGSRAHDAR
ncbi:MAG: S41 family peptidase [Verrucomicrobiota bacterium]|nr:S41 family peptidase [Verrucomicrobiota bacterium]